MTGATPLTTGGIVTSCVIFCGGGGAGGCGDEDVGFGDGRAAGVADCFRGGVIRFARITAVTDPTNKSPTITPATPSRFFANRFLIVLSDFTPPLSGY